MPRFRFVGKGRVSPMCTKRLRPEPPASSALAGSFPALDHLSNGTRRPGFRLRALASPDNIHLQNPSETAPAGPPADRGTSERLTRKRQGRRAYNSGLCTPAFGGSSLRRPLSFAWTTPAAKWALTNHSKPGSRLPAAEGKKRSPHESMRAGGSRPTDIRHPRSHLCGCLCG